VTTNLDPTRTTLLRRTFARRLRVAFRKVVARASILADTTQFFQTPAQRLESFSRELQLEVDRSILTAGLEEFARRAYTQGGERAFTDVRKLDQGPGARVEFFRLNASDFQEGAELQAQRVLEEIRGAASVLVQQLSRVFSENMENPVLAGVQFRQVTREVFRLRTNAIATTSIVMAHSEGQLDAFEALGVEEVGILAEFRTAGDSRVCPECQELSGDLFTIEQARGIIPLHPNCRCAWIPAVEVASRARLRRAIAR